MKEFYIKVTDIYSKRQKQIPDTYQYITIPYELRVQISYIIKDALGSSSNGTSKVYRGIHASLCREYGTLDLGPNSKTYRESIIDFLLEENKIEKILDVIELMFRYIDDYVRENPYYFKNREILPDDAIRELNYRFRERGVGYQYESGQIIRVDSQIAHSEIVRPALNFLSDPTYEGANAEYLSAHEHYRTRKYKECLNECLKAFESCLKVICKKREWAYNEKDTSKHLIKIVFDNELIPTFMQSHFSGLRSTLEAGVPTIRNRMSGHGQGTKEISVPESMAAYALHLTASNILLLVRADNEKEIG